MDHRLLLMRALNKTRARNPLFSLRAMARQLAVSPAHLSQLLSGKRPITLKVAMKIGEKLDLSASEKSALLQLATVSTKGSAPLPAHANLQILRDEEIEPISDWYYFAILSLGRLQDSQASAKWIATRLGIPYLEAKHAYERLKASGYIIQEDGKFRQATKPLNSTTDIPSAIIRKNHKQNLELAMDRIDTVPVEEREYASLTLALNRSKLPRAKKMIREFRAKFDKVMEAKSADEVYTLAVQLFPVTINRGNKL